MDALDWDALEAALTEKGYVLIRELLSPEICRALRELFHEDGLHRDIRGEVFFPIQTAIVLSPRRDDTPTEEAEGFQGGEFLFCDDPIRKKSDRRAIPAGLGDAILFCTRARLVSISGVYGWMPVKHGVDRVLSGTCYVLGVPFHEYQ